MTGQHRWQPGETGNPRGRPRKGKALSEVLRAYLASVDVEDGQRRSETLVDRLWQLTRSADPDVALGALKYIFERIDGKVPEPVDVNTSGKMVIEVVRVAGRPKSQD